MGLFKFAGSHLCHFCSLGYIYIDFFQEGVVLYT